MALSGPLAQVHGGYQKWAARSFCRRLVTIESEMPLISFTFDDFPRSALLEGGAILSRHGFAGTYYASLGLMGKEAPTGRMFTRDDLRRLSGEGHELGCHTYHHCHAWGTRSEEFEASVVANRIALEGLLPGVRLRTLAYPIAPPRPLTKRRMSRHFACCRGGSQRLNVGATDLNHLSAFFLEKSRDNPERIRSLIDQNACVRGWLIFATHDVSENPTRFGCTPTFFEGIVRHAAESGARILPVAEAWDSLSVR